MKHRPFIMLLMILSIVLMSGCWDRAELQDLDIVSAIGIDEGSDDVENRYQVTVQIVNEGQISGATQTGQAGMSPVTTYSATGSTISEAIRKIAPMAPQDLFFPHVQLMVIGEKMARNEGIQDLFDLIERDSQFRTLFPILIVRDHTAKTLLQITTPLESIPSTKIVGGLESSKKVWGEYASTRADQVIQQLNGEQANITGVVINGNPEEGNNLTNIQRITPEADVEIKGLAIFKKGKLKEWLEEDTARGATWINNELTETIVNLDCEKDKKGLAVDIMRSNAKIKSEIKNKKPVIHLTIRTEGHISEVHCPVDLSKHKTIEKLEKQLEKEIKEEVMLAIEAAKEQKADIFRFGETINRKDPKLWKKIEGKWSDEIFPETEVNVNIKAFIRRSGLRTKSYIK
ncbi:Ger(x)C family spore germination protein [Metabacillus litoralis]|uniref:Ger(x)C family spore germination protein n=1 Tax=Metabacillus litoralis TaxID=152268 RepID=UPI00203E15A4|nr:Ger(x)C family spore germination protein [Metabacillus litoralis]MCM3652338.1 Ger(x)C family spore germination protein [Metabacillus litoralis]